MNKKMLFFPLGILIGMMQSTAFAFNPDIQQKTLYGVVKGEKTAEGILVWKGIPYAKSPSGTLRWKAPQSPVSWNQIFDATKPARICTQLSKTGEVIGDEDCLNLNIYRPASRTTLPVLIYIHGGNNQVGNSEEFNPETLATELNAVIVSVNYRLGVLGFNPLKSLNDGDKLDDSGNYGLLDISKSLSWIKENISTFGGDNQNITVSGFSAGGRDVMAMLISPVFKTKFNRAIVFSGGMTTADKVDSEKAFSHIFAPLIVQDGIKDTEAEARQWLLSGDKSVREYLYRLPSEKLARLLGDAGIRMSAFPHLFRDGYVLPKEGFNSTSYNNVPLMMFTGQSEFSLFALSDRYLTGRAKNDTPDQVNAFNFVNHYGGKLYSLFNVEESAERMYPKYKSEIYGAEFRFGMDHDVTGNKMASIGSFHGVFMPFFDIKKYEEHTGDAYQKSGAQELGKAFKSYIRNFLVSGNPNGTGLTQWNAWSPGNTRNGESLLILDANKEKEIIYMSSKSYLYDDVLDQINNDNTVSDSDKKILIKNVLNGRWFSDKLDATYHNQSLWVEH